MRQLRIGEEKEERRTKKKPQDENVMACPIPQGGHNKHGLHHLTAASSLLLHPLNH